jgi:WD40 repeat protein/tRNA A-37 threonylcarbamoyl transferase component Bud32
VGASLEGRRRFWFTRESIGLIDERCDRYETEWTAMHAPQIKDYLDGVEGETLYSLWLELVMLDQELRAGRGESVTIADYQDSCPDPSIWLNIETASLTSMVTPEPSAASPGLISWAGVSPSVDATSPPAESAPEEQAAPIGVIEDPDATAVPSGLVFDPFQSTVGFPDAPTGPPDLPSTIGHGDSDILARPDGLAQARPGAVLGDYVLLEQLAQGGMGVVFKARQKKLNRIVALKMIKAGAWASNKDVLLFQAEAEAIAALDHPQIVPILETGEQDGLLYYSMKLIAGTNLQECLARFENQPKAIARLVVQIAEAIHHAHQRGVMHHDLKPTNILIDDRGEPHVIDFGLAKRLWAVGELISDGHLVGTPSFMAPEQARGRRDEMTTATDIYGLGALLYTLLTGHAPFSSGSVAETVRQVTQDEPRRPRARNPQADRDLETICLKCLEKEPKQRYASAQDVADELGRWLAGQPILARPTSTTERMVKWARRRPEIAVLATLLVLVAIGGMGGITWQWRQAVAARAGEHEARLLAERNEDEALKSEDYARHLAYAAKLDLAQRDWRDGNIAEAVRHLEETRPQQRKTDLRGFEWYYLDHLCRSQGRTLAGHTGVVLSVSFSPDSRRLASASLDGTVKLWDPATGQLIRTFRSSAEVLAVVFHPDGTRLASAGEDRVVTLWDAATGQAIRSFPGHTRSIPELAISPDGKTLASWALDGTIKLWDVDAGSLARTLPDHRADAYGQIAFSPDGKTLASVVGGEPTIRIWDPASGARLRVLKDPGMGPDVSLAFGPEGRILASGSEDGTIKLWDAPTGAVVRTLRDHHNLAPINHLAFSPNGQTLASASHTGQAVTVWDSATGYLLRTIKGHNSLINDLDFSPDGVHLATAGNDETVKIWDTTRDQESRSLRAKSGVVAVAFGPDGTYLVSAGLDGIVTLWDRATGQAVRTFPGHTGPILSVAISRDGRRVASASEDQSVRLWDVATGKEIHALKGHTGWVAAVAFNPDSTMLASGSGDRTIKLWDVATGRVLRTLDGHLYQVKAVAFGPDGKTLASAGNDGFVLFWDIASGRQVRAIKAQNDQMGVCTMALSPDGRHFASTGYDPFYPLIQVWDVATGQRTQTLKGHGAGVYGLAFSPDGRRLVSGSNDGTVRIWDPVFGQEVLVLRGHASIVRGVAFSPDGSRAASASLDATVKLWEANPSP